jgi:hypothetical protein
MFICCCSFLLHQSMKQWKNLIIYVIRNSNQDFFPCTFHISECRQYLLVDDNIKILELKVQMPILIFLILLISSSTILWSHSITVLGFNSFKANSILGSIWKDSLCDPNNLSNIFYLANQAFLYDIPYKKKNYMDSSLNCCNFNTYFSFDNGQHHISKQIRLNLLVNLHNYWIMTSTGLF